MNIDRRKSRVKDLEDFYDEDGCYHTEQTAEEARLEIEGFVGKNPEEINVWDISRCECAWYITILACNSIPEEKLDENEEGDSSMIYIRGIIRMLYKRIKDLGGKINTENFTITTPERDKI
jgi:hypothetical protein